MIGKSWRHLPEAYPLEAAIHFSRYTGRQSPQQVASEKGCFLTPSLINWEKFFDLYEGILKNFFEILSTNQLGTFFGFERKNF